jgi:glycosyltransferase involved in cell wall biosynthesis
MRIRLIGQRNSTGIGYHYASFADALKKIQNIGPLVEEVDFSNPAACDRAIRESQPDDVNISFVAANIHEVFQGHNVQWIVFESTKIADHIMRVLHPVDQVWVPSAWGQDVLINNGLDPAIITVVPEGVDTDIFHPYLKTPTPNRPFRFLVVGKYEQRKSFDEIIQAFAQAHGNQPDVELFIKSGSTFDSNERSQELLLKLDQHGLQNISVWWGGMETSQIAELYRDCDVFVFPSKGEGWGLPLIEAAASGLPIITTMYSGQTEFLQPIDDSVLPVDYVLTSITCPDFRKAYPDPDNNFGEWARPDVYSIAQSMTVAKKQHSDLQQRALKNSKFIRTQYTWANSATQALATMASAGWI